MSDEDQEKERLNRKLIELLNELRIALPGVQVLFAFLLILPFNSGFAETDDLDRAVYAVSLGCAAVASALLIGPAAYHRHRFRRLAVVPTDVVDRSESPSAPIRALRASAPRGSGGRRLSS
jgi:hypothetical protein